MLHGRVSDSTSIMCDAKIVIHDAKTIMRDGSVLRGLLVFFYSYTDPASRGAMREISVVGFQAACERFWLSNDPDLLLSFSSLR